MSTPTHVHPLLNAYVHGQLTAAQREQVVRHTRICSECRAALDREERGARDLINFLPRLGEPRPGQMARLWPAIWSELRAPLTRNAIRNSNRLPKIGMAFALILLCVFVSPMFFSGPAQVQAAPTHPQQFIPAEVLPTWTPARTDNPTVSNVTPEASETARTPDGPRPSPPPSVKIRANR